MLRTTSHSKMLELLCSLSTTPANLTDLMRDFDADMMAIRNRIAQLRNAGLLVCVGRGQAWIPEEGWVEARAVALDYWRSNHEP